MVVATIMVKVKPEHIADFIKSSRLNRQQSILEKGNLRFDVLQSAEDPAQFLLYEAYDSPETASNHKKTPHYAVWRDSVADWMAAPRKGIPYKAIDP